MFGTTLGIYAAVYGMLIGQIVNLLLVGGAFRGWRLPASFRPDWAAFVDGYPIRQYGILVAAALSSALFMPLANAIAAHLPSGSVAIIGMGTKVIMLVTGVIGAGMTTVLLPYFSGLAAKSNHLKAQSEFAFFLLLATILSVPIALLLRVFAAAVTYKLVAGSAMTSQDIVELIRTVQYGVAQLPFFVCSVIAIKFIVAYRRAGIILLSSFVGLALTILLSRIFVADMGVSGISLAITLALAASTSILIVYSSYLKHLPAYDSIFIIANWLLFAAMFACLHFHRIVELIIFAAIYCFLAVGGWKTLMAELRTKDAD
jgi:putative peptidoglycan lipid II flippase